MHSATCRRVKAIAVTASARLPALAAVPTMAELGVANFDISSRFGIMAPRGTPPAVVATLNEAANDALRDPAVIARLDAMSVRVGGVTPEAFQAFIDRERTRWVGIVRQTGIRVDQ